MEKPSQINPAITALIIIVLIGLGTAGVAFLNKDGVNGGVTQTSAANESTSNSNSTPTSSTYKDGEYSSQGTYITPGGRESIGLTVTIKAGTIENVDLDQQASSGDAVIYQGKFGSGYKAEVVGKNIEDVKLSRVAGSSLTSNGFNKALEQIKLDAAS